MRENFIKAFMEFHIELHGKKPTLTELAECEIAFAPLYRNKYRKEIRRMTPPPSMPPRA
jgi:hypothetical protein